MRILKMSYLCAPGRSCKAVQTVEMQEKENQKTLTHPKRLQIWLVFTHAEYYIKSCMYSCIIKLKITS